MNNIPKIELHCHLDGSVRPSTVLEIALAEKINLPTYNIEEISKMMQVEPKCQSLDEYLTKFDLANLVMQSSSALKQVTYELLEDAANENVKYIEVRFGPHLHTNKGLKLKEVIESVISGIKLAENDFDIKGNVILSSLRNFPNDSLYELIETGREFLGKGVVAIDLCALELEGFAHDYIEPLRLAKEYGYRITIHAGEAGSGTNVLESIELLGAERIGHGVHLLTNIDGYNLVKEQGILLEMCPTSNIQTKAVESYIKHPIMDFYRDGIKVSISTDNRTVSNTIMTKEMEIVTETLDMSANEYKSIFLDTIEASFADNATKTYLKEYANRI